LFPKSERSEVSGPNLALGAEIWCGSTLGSMPGKRAFEEQIAALDSLRDAEEKPRIEALREALGNRNNFIVAKAADLARELNLMEFTKDLLAAFDRFFENAEKTDPQCWAKNALSRTLAAFEYQDAQVFLRGMRHVQLEAVWGVAPTLPERCAQPARWPWCNAEASLKPIFWPS
jgi:hypothetical protein